jgi:hypothetical protein
MEHATSSLDTLVEESSQIGVQTGDEGEVTWQSWCDSSIFSFATPELEALFRRHPPAWTESCTLLCAAIILMGWVNFVLRSFMGPKELVDYAFQLRAVALLHTFMSAAFIFIILFKRAFFVKYRRTMNVVMLSCVGMTYGSVRLMLLGTKLLENRKDTHSWGQQLQRFTAENLYATTSWLFTHGFSLGQVPDLVVVTLFLLLELARNQSVCAALYWENRSPTFLGAAQEASVLLSQIGAPFLEMQSSSTEFSCKAALGFWQVVGWWATCVAVLVVDIWQRRAFLRTPEACAYLGPANAAAVSKWPLTSTIKMQTIRRGLFVLCFAASLIWNTALPYLL